MASTLATIEEAQTRTKGYLPIIQASYAKQATAQTPPPLVADADAVYTGKVRDVYTKGAHVVLAATGRQSAFDRALAVVPFKGAVLNQVSTWWFAKTADIIANHVVASPLPDVLVAKKCDAFPVEFVVRGYITGSTNTSLWTHYKNGARTYCGLDFPDGLVKNQKLAAPVLTPTTKDSEHDARRPSARRSWRYAQPSRGRSSAAKSTDFARPRSRRARRYPSRPRRSWRRAA